MSPDSPSSPAVDDLTRRWRRGTLLMQLWASAAVFFAAASAWQFHRWSQTLHDVYTRPPGVERNYKLIHRLGAPMLQEGLLDAALALLALAGTFYYLRRRKRLASDPREAGPAVPL